MYENENKTKTNEELGNTLKNQKNLSSAKEKTAKSTSEFLGKDYEIRETWTQEREGLDE